MNDILRKKGTVVCRIPGKVKKWGLFHCPVETFAASRIADVLPALEQAEYYIKKGLHVAGFISYEAAKAFDPANETRKPDDFPILWLSSYKNFSEFKIQRNFKTSTEFVDLIPPPEKHLYLKNIRRIKKFICDGDIYQANYTFRIKGKAVKSPELLFLRLSVSHPVPYSAFVNTGRHRIISNSPELFLESSSGGIRSLPMKGTASRAFSYLEDKIIAKELSKDMKNRAENIMIVDMVRNDLGRICKTGSVKCSPLFHVDTYPTVHQMVSGVEGQLKPGISISEILAATFPPASITGAPKIRAMEIISALETTSRKLYTGSIGCFMPNGDFCLNVAIRTLICSGKKTELGVGSGIVADSEPGKEYHECLMKRGFANFARPEFEILETMLWEKGKGVKYLREHLERARNSQSYFGRKWNETEILKAIKKLMPLLSGSETRHARIRLLVSEDGKVRTEHVPLEKAGWGKKILRLKLSREKTDSKNVFLYHKTTNRKFYDEEFKKAHSEGFDEIIFLNEKMEITEGAISSIFILKKGKWLTPALHCGLLPGIWRSKKICELRAEEKELTRKDLCSAEKIIVGNSVRSGAEAGFTGAGGKISND